MGRKRTPGNRSAGGGKKKATTLAGRERFVSPNDRCVERIEAFADKRILGGKAAWIDVFDGVGQLHAIGMLEGHGLDGKLLREAGREYIGLYHYIYIDMMPKGSDLERAYGSSATGKSDLIPDATRRELHFAQLDALLPMGSEERYWTHKLLLEFFGLDTVLGTVDRLVNYRFNQWNLQIPCWMGRDLRTAGADDFGALACMLRGLFALADGAMPERRNLLAA